MLKTFVFLCFVIERNKHVTSIFPSQLKIEGLQGSGGLVSVSGTRAIEQYLASATKGKTPL